MCSLNIRVIGCGNAFSKLNYNQSFLLSAHNGQGEVTRTMLVDCGYQIYKALVDSQIEISTIDDIYISHQHSDHIGSLEGVAFLRYDWVTKPRPQHYRSFRTTKAPRIIAHDYLLKQLWKTSLRGGLESMEGFKAKLSTYFEPCRLKLNRPFTWEGWNLELIQQIHIMDGSSISPSYGMFLSRDGYPAIYFTCDSQHCSPKQMEVWYQRADIIVQDCEIVPVSIKSGVHANYAELAGYPEANATVLPYEIKNKMWLSHYQDFYNHHQDFYGNFCDWDEKAKIDGFCGFMRVGHVFDISRAAYSVTDKDGKAVFSKEYHGETAK